MGLSTDLFLRVGAEYMTTTNIDTADGLVNGVTRRLRRIDLGRHRQRDNETRPLRLWLELDNERSGRNLRERHRRLLEKLNITNWTLIEHSMKLIRRSRNSNMAVLRQQFPITITEALTIHKSQGATYDAVVVHLPSRRALSRFLLYVACSRATTATGLVLVGSFKATTAP